MPEKLKMFGTGVICHKPVFCPGGYHYSWLLYVAGTGIILVLDSKFLSSVIFHVTALMPTRDSDPGGNSKKMHIGNDLLPLSVTTRSRRQSLAELRWDIAFYLIISIWKDPGLGSWLWDTFYYAFSFLSFFFLFDSVEFSGIYTVYYVLNFSFRRQGQYNFAKVLIKPLDNASKMVTVRFKDERKELLSDTGTRVISDDNLPR